MNWYVKEQLVKAIEIISAFIIWLAVMEVVALAILGFTVHVATMTFLVYLFMLGLLGLSIALLFTGIWILGKLGF